MQQVSGRRCAACGAFGSEFDPYCVVCGERLDDDPGQLRSGAMVGRFRVTGLLGRGGMGAVYRAHDTALGRDVALKLLLSNGKRDQLRFEREARAAAALDHANLVTLHEIGMVGFSPYLIMTCCDGESLAERLTRGPLPWTEAVRIGIQIAAGLAALHEAGLVHRDLTPGNVMLRRSGEVMLIDLGLAWCAELPRLTSADKTVGTVAYMAPEQLRGEAVDSRADLWSLGLLLHVMLGSSLPARDSEGGAVVLGSGSGRCGAGPCAPPAGLTRVIAGCLRQEPSARFGSAIEVRQQLQQLVKHPAERSARARSARSSLLRGLVVGALGGLLIGALLGLVARQPRAAPMPEAPLAFLVVPGDEVSASQQQPHGTLQRLLQRAVEKLGRDGRLAVAAGRSAVGARQAPARALPPAAAGKEQVAP